MKNRKPREATLEKERTRGNIKVDSDKESQGTESEARTAGLSDGAGKSFVGTG